MNAQVTHEEIRTPFYIAINCNHDSGVNESDVTCWDCTMEIVRIAEKAEQRAEAAEARAEALAAQLTARGDFTDRLERETAELKAQLEAVTKERDALKRSLGEALNSGDGVYRP